MDPWHFNFANSFFRASMQFPTNTKACQGVVRDKTHIHTTSSSQIIDLNRWFPLIDIYESHFDLTCYTIIYIDICVKCHCPHLTTCNARSKAFCESNTWPPLLYPKLTTCPMWKVQTDPNLPWDKQPWPPCVLSG